MNKKVRIIILAAGIGKRMQSEHPKVLSEVQGKAMIEHLKSSVIGISEEKPIAVVGYQAELVKSRLGESFAYVTQEKQLGTGHALLQAEKESGDAGHIVVLYGDQPFISRITIKNVIMKHLNSSAKITFAVAKVADFEGANKVFWTFARILRDKGKIIAIREFKDATDKEKQIKEVNAGCYVFEAKWLWKNLKKIKNENSQREYYLTDLFHIAFENGDKIENILIDPLEALGANSKEELEILDKLASS